MKKLTTLLFLLFSFTLSYAQQKPTKEETLQYIKNELQGKKMYNKSKSQAIDSKNNFTEYNEEEYMYSDMEMKSCILEFKDNFKSYSYTQGISYGEVINRPKEDKKGEGVQRYIDFNRTELIQIKIGETFDYKNYQKDLSTGKKVIFLSFVQKKSDGTYEKPIDIFIGLSDINFEDYKALKIYKAFEHLRKLCGAPEPISFD